MVGDYIHSKASLSGAGLVPEGRRGFHLVGNSTVVCVCVYVCACVDVQVGFSASLTFGRWFVNQRCFGVWFVSFYVLSGLTTRRDHSNA